LDELVAGPGSDHPPSSIVADDEFWAAKQILSLKDTAVITQHL